MKIQNRLITIGAAAFAAITINATASDALLSPRAAGNQIQHVTGIANTADLVAVDQGLALSPRTAGNQPATVAGVAKDVNPALACAKTMNGTPKTIQACVQQTTMPGCAVVATK